MNLISPGEIHKSPFTLSFLVFLESKNLCLNLRGTALRCSGEVVGQDVGRGVQATAGVDLLSQQPLLSRH